jgi:aminopeptidase N
VVEGLRRLDDSLARALCWGAAWDMTRDAEMRATDFVELVLTNIGSETDAFGASRIPVYAAQAVRMYAAPANRDTLLDRWESGLRELLMSAETGSDHQLTFARAYAAAAHTDQALADLQALLDGSLAIDGLAVDTDLRWTLVTHLARAGRFGADEVAEELERDNTISGQEKAAAALASRPVAEAKAEAWEQATVQENVPNETHRSICLAFMRFGQEELLAPYVEKYLQAADDIWERLGTQKASTALEYLFPAPLASPELLERLDTWLDSSPANPGAKRYVREGRDDVARALRAQDKDAAAG